MTKIEFSSFRNLSVLVLFMILLLSGSMNAQDPSCMQKTLQSCLQHPEVKPNLRAVFFDDNKDVLSVMRNSFVDADMKLMMFGKEAVISENTDLFFHSIEDYVDLTEVQIKKDQILLTFTLGDQFTSTYKGNKDKVTKLTTHTSE
jgi:hypothetical protein